MRTKSLLLTAALIAAGAVTATAQSNVYSLNVVGYVNLNLTPGFHMIANPLNNVGGNTLTSIIGTNVPDGTTIYKFANGVYQNACTFVGDPDYIWLPDTTLNPGEGAFISVPSNTTITFTGEVMQGNLTNSYPAGFSMLGSKVPQAGTLSSLGFVPKDQDTVYTFNPATQTYNDALTYLGDPDFLWLPAEPNIQVGQSFFLSTSGSGSWVRSFTVN